MKTIQLRNGAGSVIVDYDTDLQGSAKSLTVTQIWHYESGVKTLGAGATAEAAGWPSTIDEYQYEYFTKYATDNSLKMDVFETGQSVVHAVT